MEVLDRYPKCTKVPDCPDRLRNIAEFHFRDWDIAKHTEYVEFKTVQDILCSLHLPEHRRTSLARDPL